MIDSTESLPGLSLAELETLMAELGQPRFRARQVRDWLVKGICNPDAMRNLPASLRRALAERLTCEPLILARRQTSADGTRKYLFRLARGGMVESVLIPEASRATVCISSQVGCVLDCPFCHTGTQAFETNLTAGEIVAQILAVKRDLADDPLPAGMHGKLTHVVYMGMGEPLANERAVHASLALLLDGQGLNFSRRRVTLSTSGLVPRIERLGARFPVNLAISLHAATDDLRDRLVPINRKYPLARLRQCLDAWPLGPQRHITLEYVMLAGVNDREEDLRALARFVRPGRERVNLIRFNPWPDAPWEATPRDRMNAFAQALIAKGIRATVRRSRGDDIMAACGQLKAANGGRQTHHRATEEIAHHATRA